ncbi:MAG: ribosome silencing factor [Eubacteriales bacterium]|jgi:ribosome-associated protein
MMQSRELAKNIAQLLDNKKGLDIEVMKIDELTIIADYFVLCTGTSITHLRALADEVEQKLKESQSQLPLKVEGYDTGGWILMDYGSVIVHLFTDETRKYYSLERLWSDAPRVAVGDDKKPEDI